ncbi:unnamed protein product [Strongylus vulgaris]|uniref:Translocon-associated protein subunit alpha n=1 Tax=Strongylus vulgaris TaxID=40348 RepID=A0A3P7LIS5_STRVU|nr:unnamed protein product [Strongylus vulgaris]
MLSRTLLLALLGTLTIPAVLVHAEDTVDGEVTEDQDIAKTEDDELAVTSSSDAVVSFIFTQPADANTVKGSAHHFCFSQSCECSFIRLSLFF